MRYSAKIRSRNRLVQKARRASNAEEPRPDVPLTVPKVIDQRIPKFRARTLVKIAYVWHKMFAPQILSWLYRLYLKYIIVKDAPFECLCMISVLLFVSLQRQWNFKMYRIYIYKRLLEVFELSSHCTDTSIKSVHKYIFAFQRDSRNRCYGKTYHYPRCTIKDSDLDIATPRHCLPTLNARERARALICELDPTNRSNVVSQFFFRVQSYLSWRNKSLSRVPMMYQHQLGNIPAFTLETRVCVHM